jgi:hypothetical protein
MLWSPVAPPDGKPEYDHPHISRVSRGSQGKTDVAIAFVINDTSLRSMNCARLRGRNEGAEVLLCDSCRSTSGREERQESIEQPTHLTA